MTERFRERLGYLSDEFEERSMGSHLRSVSPNAPKAGSRSPHRSSRSPRPHKNVDSPSQPTVIRDSRPDIAAWPTPPNAQNRNSHQETCDEPTKLINMIKVAAASTGAPRGRETELKKKIQTLEDTVAEYERQKYNVMGTFSEYRERVAERERKLEAEYSSKIIALSEEVLGAKKDFEARMKSFQALQDKFEREKEQALEKLRQEHQKEIQLLEQRFSESQLLNLEQKYMIEIQRLEEERKSLKAEKERLGETFEMKLRRAQSLYETELTAAKMLYSKELEALRDHEEALKDELLARQDEFHDRLQELQHQSKRSREELATCKNEVTALEKRLQAKEAELLAISKELEEARNETNDSLRKLSKVESELQQTKQQYREQEEELQRKSNLLNIVETAKSKLEAVIRDLQTEVKALKNKVEFLEKERANLQSQSESQTQLQNSQVHALEAVLESVTKEKESTKEHYEGLLDKERQQAEEREYAMKKEFSAKLNELEEQYNALKEQLEQNAQRDKEELQGKTEQQISSLRSQNSILIVELNALKSKLNDRIDEGDDLPKLIDKMEELKADLEKSKERILEKEDEIKELKKQIEQENELNDDQLAVIRDEIRTELVNSGEFGCNDDEFKRLKEKVSVLEEEKRTEQTEREKLFELVKQLQTDNEHLNEQVKEFNDKTNSEANASEDDESNTSYNLKIERLMNDLREREKRIDQMEETQKRTKEEFESHLEERVEEETLKVTTMYEAKFEEVKREAEQERKKLGEEIVFLKEDSKAKSEQIEDLHSRVKNLLHEVTTIRAELDKKNIEIKNFSKKTDEYLRRRDNQQAQVLERRIINLNKEHEKTIDLMKEHEMELAAKLRKLQEEIRNKPELVSDGIQTDDLPQLKKETHQYSTQEQQTEPNEEELSTKIEELNNALKEKDEVIAHLREELFNQPCYEGSEHEGKKNRSQSVATGEHMAMCQRAASKFQTLVSQMTEKKDRSKLKNIDKVNAEGTNTECVELAKNKKDKEKEKKETEKEQDKREKEREREKERASKSSGTIHRAKSPSLLTRLRDRSPAKAKSPTMEMKTNDEKKHLLSPADAERTTVVEDRRRVSPSRQLFTRSKRDSSSQSTAALSPSLSKEESTKRPAWKF
uniref:Tag-278 n=1 Tax=Ascaris suum TaxID=6253 RepID=F1KRI0_ASCSU